MIIRSVKCDFTDLLDGSGSDSFSGKQLKLRTSSCGDSRSADLKLNHNLGERNMVRFLKGFLKWTSLLVLGIGMVGAIYQQIGLRRDAEQFPAPGEMVSVGTHQLHLYCMGEERDAPVVILEAGATFIATGWQWVMNHLAETTRVCTYDRSGFGWSEEGIHPFDGPQISDELHLLLRNSGIDQPVILVGHSLGAMIGRIHFDRYPEDLAGLVMIEPADPDIFLSEYAEERGHMAERTTGIRPCGNRCHVVTAATHLGLVRFMLSTVDLLEDPLYPSGAAEAYAARMAHPSNARTPMALGRYITRIVYQTRDNTSLADLPTMAIYSTGFGSLLGSDQSTEDRARSLGEHVAAWERTTATSNHNMGVRAIEGANHIAIVGHEEYAIQVASHVQDMIDFIASE